MFVYLFLQNRIICFFLTFPFENKICIFILEAFKFILICRDFHILENNHFDLFLLIYNLKKCDHLCMVL